MAALRGVRGLVMRGALLLSIFGWTACQEPDPPPFVVSHPVIGEVRYVPGGSYTMGCVEGRDDVGRACPSDEAPAHEVTLSRAIYAATTEFTQGAWWAFFNQNPSAFRGDALPVESVNWWEAVETANQLSALDGLLPCYELLNCDGAVGLDLRCTEVRVLSLDGVPQTCEGWRLPTEAEWEYLARGWSAAPFAGSTELDDVAWFVANSEESTHPPCEKSPNGFGLCDLSGNVWEWVWDWFGGYAEGTQRDPVGPETGPSRLLRGGSWALEADDARVANRYSSSDVNRSDRLGFRLVRTLP